MTDLDYLREALARANERYTIAVAETGTTVTVQGPRNRPPQRYQPVTFTFSPQGVLLSVRGEEVA